MTDKMHENWAKPTVPVWEEIKPPQVYGTAKELVHSLRHGYPSPLRIEAADVIDKQAAEIDALRKRVQELESAQQWMSIESAPKDGTDVLVMYMHIDTQIVHNAFYAAESDGWEADSVGWWSYEHSEVSRVHLTDWMTPTHWMPLPQPPIEKGRLDVEGHPV